MIISVCAQPTKRQNEWANSAFRATILPLQTKLTRVFPLRQQIFSPGSLPSGKAITRRPKAITGGTNFVSMFRMLYFNRQIHTCYHNIFWLNKICDGGSSKATSDPGSLLFGSKEGTFPESGNLIYSRRSRKRPPRELEKMVVTRAGRLREWNLVSDQSLKQ